VKDRAVALQAKKDALTRALSAQQAPKPLLHPEKLRQLYHAWITDACDALTEEVDTSKPPRRSVR
jgi:hypothetical protein